MRGLLRTVANLQAEQVDGEKARAFEQPGGREYRQAGRDDDERQHTAVFHRQRQPAQQARDPPGAGQTEGGAEADLAQQQQRHVQPAGIALDRRDQRQHQEHRHRVVQPRFQLQRGRDPFTQSQAGLAQHREHGRGVGGADDGAEQQAVAPFDVHDLNRHRSHQRRRQQHTDAGQQQRRFQAGTEGFHARADAAFEQDHRERRIADPGRELRVVEPHADRSVDTDEHAGEQEHQQERQAQARRQHTGQQAAEHQHAAGQQHQVE